MPATGARAEGGVNSAKKREPSQRGGVPLSSTIRPCSETCESQKPVWFTTKATKSSR